MKVLVTGGSGFIGSAVVRRLIAEGEAVVNVDALTYAAVPGALAAVEGHAAYTFERADIADAAALERIFARHRPDRVLHLAAESHVDRSIDAPAAFVSTNVVGTWRLLEASLAFWSGLEGEARAAFRFHHVSTDEVYGALGPQGRFDEASPYAPRSPYAATKAASDHLATAWGATYGLPVVLTNCTNNYGPWQFADKLVPLMVVNALTGRPLPLYGDGLQVRDWLFVEDHAEALAQVLRRAAPGARYGIGGGAERTNLDLAGAIADLVDEAAGPLAAGRRRRELITFVADRPGHDRRYAMDAGRIARELGWRPRTGLAAGLARTVAWYLDNRAWWEALGAGRDRRLGLSRSGNAPA
jgi:dTDP-glucose 4,6-dehydratase